MKHSNAIRWALVTFSLGISCAVMGSYMPRDAVFIFAPMLSLIFALFGGLAIEDD